MSYDNTVLVGVIIYIIGMLVVGKLAERKTKNSADEYLVAGRNMPLWMVTATLFATWWGAATVLGAAGAAYSDGVMGTLEDPWACGFALIIAGLFFMKICRDMKLRSMGSFYRNRFGKTTGIISSYALIPGYVLWLAVQMLAIAKIFQVLFNWPFVITTIVGAIIVIFYTYSGGILAVAWTDFIQMLLIVVGLFFLVPISVNVAGGWHVIQTHTPENFWQIFPAFGDWDKWLWWLSVMICISLGNIPGPDLMQRAFIAKDSSTARKCGVIAGFMYLILGIIPIIASLCFKALAEQGHINPADLAKVTQDNELVILYLSKNVLSAVPAAIFTAALLAAIMSSADSSLFASAAIISNDICPYYYQKIYKKEMSDLLIYKAGRLAVLGTGIAALIITFFSTSLYQLLIFSIVYMWHMLFFPFMLGIYWKRCNACGATSGMIVGLVVLLYGCITQTTAEPEPEWIWNLLPALCSLISVIAVSLFTQSINPPLPLTSEDGKILKWPEFAGNLKDRKILEENLTMSEENSKEDSVNHS